MTINIKLVPSEEYRWEKYTPADFDLTEEEWMEMSTVQQHDLIRGACHDHPEQPYWVVDYIETR